MWCAANCLHLNVAKTKELVVDFRKLRTDLQPVCINGVFVDSGVKNTEVLYRKGISRLFVLKRLSSFNVCKEMMLMFYHSVVASVMFFGVVSWRSRLKVADVNRFNKLIGGQHLFKLLD
ncbi:hypothetical protein XELAEV_18008298mg [Xenopus laevis]|uniref:Uncharacterized protein n=1 Tax=Xenopus laevis TaxID=8355 RepID=A0A974E3F3_XENLA|nr:hypothetical protein XELAEV_18008298mg [Xenopus laevis]